MEKLWLSYCRRLYQQRPLQTDRTKQWILVHDWLMVTKTVMMTNIQYTNSMSLLYCSFVYKFQFALYVRVYFWDGLLPSTVVGHCHLTIMDGTQIYHCHLMVMDGTRIYDHEVLILQKFLSWLRTVSWLSCAHELFTGSCHQDCLYDVAVCQWPLFVCDLSPRVGNLIACCVLLSTMTGRRQRC